MTAEKTEIIGLTEFKRNMERWTKRVNEGGVSLLVCKRNRPWVCVVPAARKAKPVGDQASLAGGRRSGSGENEE